MLDFRQSPYNAVTSFNSKYGLCSLWYEFDIHPITMGGGLAWYKYPDTLKEFHNRAANIIESKELKKAPLRPDIVILQGGSNFEELLKGFYVKMIIECKNWDFSYWSKDIDLQIIPYKEIFQPDNMVLVSLKKVPEYVKTKLNGEGIIIVDEVYPNGRGETELLKLVRNFI